jgi:hypothetical protein
MNRNLSVALGAATAGVCLANAALAYAANAQTWGDSIVVPRPAIINGNQIIFEPDAYIELRISDDPTAIAEIVFNNRRVNGPKDNGTYHLTLGEVIVDLTFTWDPDGIDDDRIEILIGPSFWTFESSIDVREGSEALILIYPPIS